MPPTEPSDELTLRAMLKWPDVPASFGWLGLDGRGRWLIQGATISHPGICDFLARQYGVDSRGRWYVQNGPQRAFVDLEFAPWVLSLDGHGDLITHTARAIDRVDTLIVADTGQIFLATELGLGVLLDRDLASFLGSFGAPGRRLSDAEAGQRLLALPSTGSGERLRWRHWEVLAIALPLATLEVRYGFVREPRDDS